MSTTVEARPTPGAHDPTGSAVAPTGAVRRGPLRRIAGLRQTTPGRLQLILAVLLTLGLLTGLVAGLTARSAGAGTGDLGNRAQPLLFEAETIYSALADADTTAAQAFLAGGLEPPALTRRYEEDLTQATTALTSAARRTPDGGEAAQAVAALSAGVSHYAALVATARADNRQGLPIGASYLSAASQINRDELLPQAQKLFRIAQREVVTGYADARSAGWMTASAILILVLLGALLLTQRRLSRVTHRTFNVPLVAATALTLLLALGLGTVLVNQNAHLSRAADQGSTPAAQLAEGRILALRERGAEALALAAHGSAKDEEKSFVAAQKQLTAAQGPLSLTTQETSDAHQSYLELHQQIRALDSGGDYDKAVKLAVDPATTKVFETVTSGIGTALTQRKAVFSSEIDDAGHGLGLLTVLGPLLALLVCLLAAAGIRARLEEYR